MRLEQLLAGVAITASNADWNTEITGVCFDSRKVTPGCLFVAVVGYVSDGHQYIAMAVEKGAACVLCQNAPEGEIPYVQTADTRKGLALVSANWFDRPAEKMKIVGVTGTNGKTTTTNLIKTILEEKAGAKVGLLGTNNNMIGDLVLPTERTTPESYEIQELFARMYREGCTHIVMEVSSHALYLDRVYGIDYAVGVFTNLTQDHLDFHKTMENYGRAKAILFRNCAYGCINADDPYAGLMTENATCRVLTYGAESGNADFHASGIRLASDHVDFDGTYQGETKPVTIGIPGRFSVYNAMAAITACLCLGVSFADAVDAIGDCGGVMGRAEVVPTGREFTMLIDYAHTPDALENILSTVRATTDGRVVILFGCGGDRDRTKRPIMGKIAAELADFVIVTSDNPRTEQPDGIIRDILAGMEGTKTPYVVIENRKEAIGWAIDNARPGDVIILAGKGHETYQIIGTEKRHFDEREVIRAFLNS